MHRSNNYRADQTISILFKIPREMRNDIYHNLFLICGGITHAFPCPSIKSDDSGSTSYPADPLHRFEICYSLSTWTARTNDLGYGPQPKWLLACKATLHEGMAQFVHNAEWLWRGYYINAYTDAVPSIWDTLLDTRRITRMELHVANLGNYHTPNFSQSGSFGSDSRTRLARIADSMRSAQMSMGKIRLVGYSYSLNGKPEGPHCSHQVGNMMRNMMSIFKGVQVDKWELGIWGKPHDCYWVLFELVEGELCISVDDRVTPPTRQKIGAEWIRQELKQRAEEEARMTTERRKEGRDWIQQELAARRQNCAATR